MDSTGAAARQAGRASQSASKGEVPSAWRQIRRARCDLFAAVVDADQASRSIVNELNGYLRELQRDGYAEIKTPLLYNKALWEVSGHWGKYKEWQPYLKQIFPWII